MYRMTHFIILPVVRRLRTTTCTAVPVLYILLNTVPVPVYPTIYIAKTTSLCFDTMMMR